MDDGKLTAVLGELTQEVDGNGTNCPDTECNARLIWIDKKEVKCQQCGQVFKTETLRNVVQTRFSLLSMLQTAIDSPNELIEVNGICNLECRLLSPLLTSYGIDRSGRPQLIKELYAAKRQNGSSIAVKTTESANCATDAANLVEEVFDVSVLCDRSFLIDSDRLDQAGYGIDSQAKTYLSETLDLIRQVNAPLRSDASTAPADLVPLVTTADGRCLAHAVSRALVGRELFTHALLTNLHRYMAANWDRLTQVCSGFLVDSDKSALLAECAPEAYGKTEQESESGLVNIGLRPLHILGLANLLRRPIVVLDSLARIRNKAEYACLYLPILQEPASCGSVKHGSFTLNEPLCIAWANAAHNHFVPLVGISGRATTRLPLAFLEKAFCASADTISKYVETSELRDATFEECPCCKRLSNDCQSSTDCAWLLSPRACSIGGVRSLSPSYLAKLVRAMREQFLALHDVDIDFVTAYYRVVLLPAASQSNGVSRVQNTREHEIIDRACNAYRAAHWIFARMLRIADEYRCKPDGDREAAELQFLKSNSEKAGAFKDYSKVMKAIEKRATPRCNALMQRESQILAATLQTSRQSNRLLGDNPFATSCYSTLSSTKLPEASTAENIGHEPTDRPSSSMKEANKATVEETNDASSVQA